MLTCQDVIGLLLEYVEGTLGADAIAEFERHLDACGPCRAYLRTYQRTRELTAEVTRVEMPAELKILLRELLLRQLTAERPQASRGGADEVETRSSVKPAHIPGGL